MTNTSMTALPQTLTMHAKRQPQMSPEQLKAYEYPELIDNVETAVAGLEGIRYASNPVQGHFIEANAKLHSSDGQTQNVNVKWPFDAFKAETEKSKVIISTTQDQPRPMTKAEEVFAKHTKANRLKMARTPEQRASLEKINELIAKQGEKARHQSRPRKIEASELPGPLKTLLFRQLSQTNPTHSHRQAQKAAEPEVKDFKKAIK